ncbi:efflux RND transporter permease subunit [Amorphus orientalis]|uniref:Multidrug efflux pump subunit AcrB n=1 Tax=Amorphus orientalis TaxID=649198 RepID=A0AAE3VRE9_9HYPH|nr:efflux RND transporter permease subunit [Amorphus orientalis]MDQ0316778.1 multidrug efflux pump subunit AcrB [Amorphus orientalis]
MSAPAPRRGGLIGIFVRHPNAANLLMVLMLIAGVAALMRINTQFFPTIEEKQITISISWPGASAEDVAANILDAVEPAVRFLDGVEEITSYAREGAGTTILEFDPATDMQKALSDVEQELDRITTLPEESERPTISSERFHDTVAKLILTGPFPESALQVYAKRIRDDLLDRGIDKVTFSDFRDREVAITVAEPTLLKLDMTIGDIAGAIADNTLDRPSGTVGGTVEKQVRALAPGETPETIRDIEVKGFAGGERISVGEIASVGEAFDDDALRGIHQGNPAIGILVQRAVTADALETDAILKTYLTEVRGQLPPTLQILETQDQASFLWDRINLLVRNGWQGLLVVLVVLFTFLNARIATWVALGIPISMAATLGIMFATGQTINMMSLFALIMMLGIIVDDAIVVAEQAATREAAGEPPPVAAERGALQMITPVTAASLTTIAAFAPLFLLGGVMGQMIEVLPLVTIAVLTASLIECFLVLPAHLAHSGGGGPAVERSGLRQIGVGALIAVALALVLAVPAYVLPPVLGGIASRADAAEAALGRPLTWLVLAVTAFAISAAIETVLVRGARRRAARLASGGPQRSFRTWFDRNFAVFRDRVFGGFVDLAYRWRYATIAAAVAALIVVGYGLVAGGRIGFVFFPSPEAESLRATLEVTAGTPEDEVIAAVETIREALDVAEQQLSGGSEALIRSVTATLGAAGRNRGDNLAEFDVQLTASEARSVRTPEIVRAWREAVPDIPGMTQFAINQRRGGPPGRDLDIKLTGASPAVLKDAAQEVIAALEGVPGVSAVSDDLPYGKPELTLELTPRGSALGFTLDSVATQVRNAFQGVIARRIPVGDEEVKVRVQLAEDGTGDAALREMWLKSPSGIFAPLSEVVSLNERDAFSVILRRDGKTTVSVTADVDHEVNTGTAVTELLRTDVLPEIAARYGVGFSFAGRDEERRESFADLKAGTVIALSVIYIILAWVFGSYWRPLAVMAIIPFGLVGAVLGHLLLGFNLTIMSLIGLLGLTGILVNDSIILVSRLDERLRSGDDLATAAVGASRDRLRAVLLTSLTTIGGLTPLLFETSLQAQFLLPMAITMVFGIAAATVLVLILVPSLIGIGGDIGRLLATIDRGGRGTPGKALVSDAGE